MRQAILGRAFIRLFSLRAAGTLVIAAALGAQAAPAAAAANGKYAAIVVDANTGRTLHAENADAARFPASLTKMMTLYLTFEAMKAGRISKNTKVPFSAHAASMPPTKIGVRAGGSITVETAILSLVTKSANDAAAALGELLGGSEAGFARMMTAKARRLGMASTTFQNASGLPNPQQRTTARDMATLGLALREHFPQYYGYFSTRSFTLGRQRMGNHNKLLGRMKGVDGIKTGYTRASGFNLVTSVADGNRRIVAVVMGGTSGRSRDDRMVKLINTYLPKASSRKGDALIAAAEVSPRAEDTAELPKRNAPQPEAKPAEEQVAAVEPSPRQAEAPEEPEATVAEAAQPEAPAVVERAYVEPAQRPAQVDALETAGIGGWAIQVASSPSEAGAKSVLAQTTEKAGAALRKAKAYTVPFEKGGTTFYRARFGGFGSKTAAWNACAALKKKKIACYAIQQ